MKQRFPSLWVLVLVALYLVAAWWPFRLDLPRSLPNGAVVADGAVWFERPGLLAWDPAPVRLRSPSPWTVELRVRPAAPDQIGPARILEVGCDHHSMNLMVGQSGAAVVVRVRRPESDEAGAPPLVGRDVFAADRATGIAVRVADQRIELRIDGALVDSRSTSAPTSAWLHGLPLTMGDSPVGDRAWLGRVERARVVGDGWQLDLLETAAAARPESILRVPERLRIVLDHRLFPPTNAFDVLLNILAFLPLGFGLAGRGSRRFAVAIALCVSATMELGQIAIADRVPSLLDLLLNVGGAWLGAVLATRRRA